MIRSNAKRLLLELFFKKTNTRGKKNRASLVAQTIKSPCNAGDLGSIFGSERSPTEGNGYNFAHLYI